MGKKSFKFKLQSVLDFKAKMEDEEKRKLGEIMALQAREEQVLVQIQQMREMRIREYKAKQAAGAISVTDLQMYAYTIEKLKNDIINQQLRLKEIAIRVEEQREALMKATQEKKIYEKLKEKQHQAWIEAEEFEEKKLIDELATIKYARDQRNAAAESG